MGFEKEREMQGRMGKMEQTFHEYREKGRPVGEITEENKEISENNEGSRKNNIRENLKEMRLFSLQQKYRRNMITIL